MTEADWHQRFDDLEELHLIDFPDDFYSDDLYFKDPDSLN